MKQRSNRVFTVTVGIVLNLIAIQAKASTCPKGYIDRFNDERNTKKAEYWIREYPSDVELNAHQLPALEAGVPRLDTTDYKAFFVKIAAERPADFKCIFIYKNKGNYLDQDHYFEQGECVNSAGYKWNPWSMDGTAYTSDGNLSFVLVDCNKCTVYMDKSGKKFIIDEQMRASIFGNLFQKATIIKDGSKDLEMEAIVMRPFFDAGNKKSVIIGREIENGFTCTYKSITPNL